MSGGYARRVIVKARFVKLSASSMKALSEHLRYIGRDSAVDPGDRGRLFGVDGDDMDTAAFQDRASSDRHHFRLIVSPEDGAELADLKSHIRDLASAMETDLGTRLDWVGAVHTNTDHPHAHMVIRGARDDGTDLVMPRRYISHGIRECAEALVTRELGPETQYERGKKSTRDIEAERLTRIDRSLDRLAGTDRTLSLADTPARYRSLNQARLRKLGRMGLAASKGRGQWQLAEGFAATLKEMGERGDIIKALNRALAGRPGRRLDPHPIARSDGAEPMLGEVVSTGLGGPGHDQPFIILDLTDGRGVRLATSQDHGLKSGMIVEAKPQGTAPKPSDLTISRIAEQNIGVYSAALHQSADPSAGAAYIAAHVRRLEALRRAGLVSRSADGTWRVPQDHLQSVTRWQARTARNRPAELHIQSAMALRDQVQAPGLTWLDDAAEIAAPRRGFGAELTRARLERQIVLRARGELEPQESDLSRTSRARLASIALDQAGADAAGRFGKPYARAPESGPLEGRYVGAAQASHGKFAVIDRGRDITLVPWRSVIERARGQTVSGMVRAGRVDWRFGRGRGR